MIDSTVRRDDYVGTGLLDTYQYTFKIQHKNDLLVIVLDDQGVVQPTMVVDVDYTVQNVGYNDGGTIVLTAGDLEADYKLIILGNRAALQESDVRNRGSFYPHQHETFFDHIIMISQQILETLTRVMKVNPWIHPDDFDTTMPDEVVETGADRYLKIKDDGTGFELGNPATAQIAIGNLTNVDVTGAVVGDVLHFDGTDWVDSSRLTDAEADIVTAQAAADAAQADATQAISDASDAQTDATQALADAAAAQLDIDNHLADPTGAHAASAISNVPAGNLSATDQQSVNNELQGDIDGIIADIAAYAIEIQDAQDTADAAVAGLAAHEADTSTHGVGEIVGRTESQNLTNKILTEPVIDDGMMIVEENATPANPQAGTQRIYFKNDGKLYKLTPAGVETEIITMTGLTAALAALELDDLADVDTTGVADGDVLTFDSGSGDWVPAAPSGGGGGAGGLIWYTSTSSPGPTTEYLTDLEFDVYPVAGGVYKYAILNVPDSYVAGNQITLKKGVCVVNSTDASKDIHFKVQRYLLRVGQSASTLADTNTSTNAEIAVGGTANIFLSIGDIDITNASGEIDGVAVSPGDRILMQFYRSTDTETASVPADVLFLKDSLIPDFGG